MDIQFFHENENARFKYRCAALIIENNHLLLQSVYDYWTPPGGKVAMMENTKDAVVREIYEESGQNINILKYLFTAELFYIRHQRHHHELGIYYLAESKSLWEKGKRITGSEGGKPIQYQWVPLDELKSYNIQPAFLLDYIHHLNEAPPHIIVDER